MVELAHPQDATAGAAPAPLSPSLATNVGYLLHRSFQHVQRDYLEKLEDKHPRDLALLARLLAAGPQPQHELAQCMSVNRSVMVGVLDSLEQSGLVQRARNPDDRRSYTISATAAAAETLALAAPALLAADAYATRRLRVAQRRRLRALLGTLLGTALPQVVAPVSEIVGYRIARAHFMLHARADHALASLGVEVREVAVLMTVRDVGPCSQQQIATLHDVSGPVIVELIDALESRELIARDRNPTDRRSYALRLTTAGETLLAGGGAALASIHAEIVERLGEDTTGELCELLRAMLGAAPLAL